MPRGRPRRGRWLLLYAMSAVPGSVLEAQIPSPASVLGHGVGADYQLADWDEALGYLERLAAATDVMEMRQIGYTAEGRPWHIALISSPENLASVERHREISRRLAWPAGLTDADARALAREGKAIVHIDGGLHSTEVANAQHTLQLAYDLVRGQGDPAVARVLDEVVLMLWPSLNPDGLQMVADWYAGNVGTPYEVAPLPYLYQKYVGHDNNRDAYMLNTVESRVVNRVWREWEPQIIHVHHQSSPFPTRIWLPPFAEPVSPHAPPLIARTVNMIGMAMARALEENGQPGATHMDFFDAWYPGYIDYLPIFQNIAAYWTETALYRYATPRFYTIQDFPEYRRGLRAESLYASPWEGGWWRLRDAVEYMHTASMAVLDYAARYREELLYNRYQAGRDQMRKYAEQPPYAYLLPAGQRDPVAVAELLRRLAVAGVPVRRLRGPATFQGVDWDAGTWVIPMDHPFAELVRELLEIQVYPDLREFPDGPPSQPYDVAGWTLGHLMGVRVIEAQSPLPAEVLGLLEDVSGPTVDWRTATGDVGPAGTIHPIDAFRDAASRPGTRPDVEAWDTPRDHGFNDNPVAAGIQPPMGRVQGSGSALRLDPSQNNAFRAVNRAWDLGGRVAYDASGLYTVQGLSGERQLELVRELALQATRGPAGSVPLSRPRVGLYRPWRASMDEGWTRWLLERFDFDFRSVRSGEIRAGELEERYDVLILPSESPGALRDGHAVGSVPARFAGGLGDTGLRALDAFVRAGGTLVALNASSDLVIEALGLPVQNVLADLPRDEFFSPGSIFEAWVEAAHPVTAGTPERSAVFFDQGPAFRTTEDFEGTVLLRYAEDGSPLVSGYLLGEASLQGQAAAVEVRHGEGRVVLFGFRPQWRGQTFGTFRLLFGAVLNAPAPAS